MAQQTWRVMGGGVATGAGAAAEPLNLREVWRALMRRRLLFLAPVVLITLGAFLWAKQQPPMYTAEALLHVQNRNAQVLEIEGVVEDLDVDAATIESEVEFIGSPAFVRRTVQQLDLSADPEFAPWLRPEEAGPIGRLLGL
ncbi:MAG: Wzz/FepE/Etk N-terminal domain-containing protein, partial [Geminicoccaceae bacterium]